MNVPRNYFVIISARIHISFLLGAQSGVFFVGAKKFVI